MSDTVKNILAGIAGVLVAPVILFIFAMAMAIF